MNNNQSEFEFYEDIDTVDLSIEKSEDLRKKVKESYKDWCPRCNACLVYVITYTDVCSYCGYPSLKSKEE